MNSDRLLSTFSMIGEDPARIQQLRQIAVALAIAGKLGADSAVISHCDMLRVVEQVRRDLYAKRQIPKPKNYKPIEQDELPGSFPDAGRFVPLGSLARVEKGLTGIKQAQPGPFPLVVTGAERASCDHFDFERAAAIVPLVSSTGHGHASLNRLHYQEGKFALGTILAAIFPYDPSLISARFIFEYLSAFKEELLVARMTGTANVTLSVGRIMEVPVPLIDPAIQSKLDDLMVLLDRMEAARIVREATRDRLTVATLARLTAPDQDTEAFPSQARFTLDALPALTARPDQIKRLRQTILSLAVRGKLVAQEATDEAITENYDGVSSETTVPFCIPQSWKWCRLQSLGTLKGGGTPSKARDDFWNGHIPWVSPKDMKVAYINSAQMSITGSAVAESAVNLIEPESILFVVRGMILAHSFPVAISKAQVTINQDMKAIILKKPETAEYVLLALKGLTPEMLLRVQRSSHGTCRIEGSDYGDFLIPLPPLAEQRRIVAKVDALMALCDRLDAALTSADTARQLLLEALLHEALASTDDVEVAA